MFKLTYAQNSYIYKQVKDLNVEYIGIGGSHQYGLAHEGSDIDIKVVYTPTVRDMLKGNTIRSWKLEDKDLNIEIEVISFPSFLMSITASDTNCFDMIHNHEHFILFNSPIWDQLVAKRKDLYAKNMRGFVSYIKSHTTKFTNKIERFDEMNELLEKLGDYALNTPVADTDIPAWVDAKAFKYIHIGTMFTNHEQAFLEVCGKKYTQTWSVETVRDTLSALIRKYGCRTKMGSKSGMDSKGLSHAYRVMIQLSCIIHNGDLTFPLINTKLIMDMKMGVTSYEAAIKEIDIMYDEVIGDLAASELPEFGDTEGMYNLVEDYIVKSVDKCPPHRQNTTL